MLLFKCGVCGFSKKHYFGEGSQRKVACRCGEAEKYTRQVTSFNMTVNYNTLEEIFEYEIDPAVQSTLEKIGTEMVNGDVATFENLVGETAMKENFFENDTWLDEQTIIDMNK
jgi:hypothetical protein